ncbi:DUF882 domain-containing protein [Salipiger thiooxidans]|uniref:D-Ala-D-Ala carboxypeptidase family metallohydrolase n=1 Tax=Salipiger thiooxidans TaxID=282683 RepID=UPI001A907F27|nr:DUF882 domain-containing protein [Salipiger thiooxidans]
MADVHELGVRYRAEGQEQVKQANRDIASTGKQAEQATKDLEAAQERRSKADKEAATTAAAVTRATTEATQAAVTSTRATQGQRQQVEQTTRAMVMMTNEVRDAAAAQKVLQSNTVNATRAMSGFDMRGPLLQMSQIVQQTAATGNLMQSVAIQAADIGMYFGAIGTAAGIAATLLIPLVAGLFDAAEEGKDLNEVLDDLSGTVGGYRDAADLALSSAKNLTEEFGSQAEAIREQLELAARLELSKSIDALAIATKAANEDLEDMRNIVDAIASGRAYTTGGRFQRLSEELGLTLGQMQMVLAAMDNLAAADGPAEASEAARSFNELLVRIFGGAEKIPDALRNISLAAIEVDKDASRIVATTEDIEEGVKAAAEVTLTFAKNMERAFRAADSISGVEFSNLGDATRWGAGLWGGDAWIPQPNMAPWTQPRSSFSREGMDPTALTALARLEAAAGQLFNVTSDYRSPSENKDAGGARGSQHMSGRAFDIDVSGMTAQERIELIRLARSVAGFGGVGVYSNSLHFDTGPTRAWGPDYSSGSIPGWAYGATQTARAGEAEETRAQAQAEREAAQAARERTRELERTETAYDRVRAALDPLNALEMEYEKAKEAVQDARKAGLISLAEEEALLSELSAKYQQDLDDLNEEMDAERLEAVRQGWEGLTQTLLRAAQAGESIGDALRSWLADAVLQAAARDLVNTLSSIGGGGGIFGSIAGWLFGGANANGNAFSGGSVIPFASGGVVNGPTYFGMSGGRTGLMGEAGPEAIMPLTRGADGKLGVHGQGGAVVNMKTEIIPAPGQTAREERETLPDGTRLQRFIMSEAVNEAMTTPGGAANRTLRNRGVQPPRPLR